MRISVRQMGGFVGETVELGTIDTEQLDAASAQRIESVLRGAGLFDPPARNQQHVGADLGLYEITVTDGCWEDRVTVTEDGSPETARLLGLLRALITPPADGPV